MESWNNLEEKKVGYYQFLSLKSMNFIKNNYNYCEYINFNK